MIVFTIAMLVAGINFVQTHRSRRAAAGSVNLQKYLLMRTSSNFGKMVSMAATAFLPFLPMRPTQVLLNNCLYPTRPSRGLTATVTAVLASALLLPYTFLAEPLGLAPLPLISYGFLTVVVVTSLILGQIAKTRSFAPAPLEVTE